MFLRPSLTSLDLSVEFQFLLRVAQTEISYCGLRVIHACLSPVVLLHGYSCSQSFSTSLLVSMCTLESSVQLACI